MKNRIIHMNEQAQTYLQVYLKEAQVELSWWDSRQVPALPRVNSHAVLLFLLHTDIDQFDNTLSIGITTNVDECEY